MPTSTISSLQNLLRSITSTPSPGEDSAPPANPQSPRAAPTSAGAPTVGWTRSQRAPREKVSGLIYLDAGLGYACHGARLGRLARVDQGREPKLAQFQEGAFQN